MMHVRTGFALAVACGLLWFVWPRTPTPSGLQPVKPVKAWLEDLRMGGDGSRFWRSDGIRKLPQFYAVQSYEIVSVPGFGTHMVRIHSSTQEGTPLVRLYEVMADQDKVYRVTAQGDDPDEDVKRLTGQWHGP